MMLNKFLKNSEELQNISLETSNYETVPETYDLLGDPYNYELVGSVFLGSVFFYLLVLLCYFIIIKLVIYKEVM